MAIDYDKIQQGRRREWKELLSPEERARRRKEDEASDPEKKKGKSWLRLRDDQLEEQRERDKVEWQRAKTRVQRMLIGALVVVAVLMISSVAWFRVSQQRMTDKIAKLEPLIQRGQTYMVYKDPVDAWASWRSALIRRDGKSLARVESTSRVDRNRGTRDASAYAAQIEDQMKRNALASDRHIAASFSGPVVATMPDIPWGDGELAVFASQPIAPLAPNTGRPRGGNAARSPAQPTNANASKAAVWVAVFSYNRRAGEWRFEDLRQQRHWDPSWLYAGQIRPVIEMERKEKNKRSQPASLAP